MHFYEFFPCHNLGALSTDGCSQEELLLQLDIHKLQSHLHEGLNAYRLRQFEFNGFFLLLLASIRFRYTHRVLLSEDAKERIDG